MPGLLLLLRLFAAGMPASGPAPVPSPRILFIGNSLTYVNDLPAMVRAIAVAAGQPAPETEAVAFPNFALEDHWAEGTARRRLEGAHWDFVVLQQGPSSLPESRENLTAWTERFAPLIRAAGAEPVLCMVWPERARMGAFPRVGDSYRSAAAKVGGIFAPAGEAWRVALAEDSAAPVYGGDGFHPAPAGTYLAAVVILGRVRALDPRSLPPTIPNFPTIPEATVAALQRAGRRPGRPTGPTLKTWSSAQPPRRPRASLGPASARRWPGPG